VSTTDSWPGEARSPDDVAEADELQPDEDEPEELDEDTPDEADSGDGDAVEEDEPGDDEPDDEDTADEPQLRLATPADELVIPDDIDVLEGEPRSTRRGVGIVVSRTDTPVANRLLEAALAELDRAGVGRDHLLVMPVPGPFELPIAAMALAKTRRYACIVALGTATASAVVAGEAASGIQLAGLETGVPIAFGVLTDGDGDAEAHAVDAVRTALEMADLFHQLRASAQAAK
jgi:6,7-dimethyl-8-ribityllumazine synthase